MERRRWAEEPRRSRLRAPTPLAQLAERKQRVSPPASPATTESPAEEQVVRPLQRSRLKTPQSFSRNDRKYQLRRATTTERVQLLNSEEFRNLKRWSLDSSDSSCIAEEEKRFYSVDAVIGDGRSLKSPEKEAKKNDEMTSLALKSQQSKSDSGRLTEQDLNPWKTSIALVENNKMLNSRVHYLTQALICANQHHKKTQEHLAWALNEKNQGFQPKQVVISAAPAINLRALQNFSRQTRELQQHHSTLKSHVQEYMQAMFTDISQLRLALTSQLEATTARYDAQISLLQSQNDTMLKERRILHSTIQELRGNIRVLCRVRPASGRHAVFVNSSEMLTISSTDASNQDAIFTVDKVFDPNHTQLDIFMEMAPLVTSALDGYNVCILAYGQTGSGKTHTMLGDVQSEASSGLCVRIFRQLFEDASADLEYETQVEVSCVEIYNEKLVDLLTPGQPKLDIYVDKKSGVSVPNRKWLPMQSVQKCIQTMDLALRYRAIGANDLNDKSSRSHCITSLRIRRSHQSLPQTLESKIHLVDLAGSERLGTSNSHGERKVEAQHINKSLSTLRHVLLQLKNKDEYISYRNSKLTMLLQDAIGGQAKTFLLVCVNPLASCAQETKCSLVFGERANRVELGKAKQNVKLKK